MSTILSIILCLAGFIAGVCVHKKSSKDADMIAALFHLCILLLGGVVVGLILGAST